MKLTQLNGIGEKTEGLLNKVGITDVESLATYYPYKYETFDLPMPVRKINGDTVGTVKGIIKCVPLEKRIKNLSLLTVEIIDEEGQRLKLVWFNMPFIKNKLRLNQPLVFRGKIRIKPVVEMEQPAIYTIEEYAALQEKIFPKYFLTEGLSNKTIQKAMNQALKIIEPEENLPKKILEKYHLVSYRSAIQNIHFPADYESLRQARRRLAFEEFFVFIYTLRYFQGQKQEIKSGYKIFEGVYAERLIENLPYRLTGAQKKAFQDIRRDWQKKQLMSRLIQGDVGSGKTVIALLALLDIAESGFQGALMAPTEILAMQHYNNISDILDTMNIPFNTAILTGSQKAKERTEILSRIKNGEVSIIIGTHALFQDKVEYKNLALVITDEQHRFGVRQRENFAKKGNQPHMLVMSATPIPRTLALILYGDLDISVINELPEGRLPIKNCLITKDDRHKAYKFISEQTKQGRQVYVICPMVEDNEEIEAENVVDYSRQLQKNFGKDLRIEHLHGKMKPEIKNGIMCEFEKGYIDILVSTTVIEVGVNVPNATVIMIENAERFGLAGLHQLRGRVGRGNHQSYCIFVSGSDNPSILNKLEIVNNTNDGFVIAEEDLKTRGPGDIFGVQQSGEFRFKAGDIYQDAPLISLASEAVSWVYSNPNEVTLIEIEKIMNKCRSANNLLTL